ncbi:MAG: ABC transporter substrate-binding protein [Oscillibacter sp.]|nr:ABC transporter substrate-binding protein [Oscillibacter sp.]
MKKFFGILLTLAMVLSLAACGGGNDKPADSSTPPADSSTPPADSSTPPADSSQPSADAPSGSASGTFKLGGVGPLTGDAAIYGNAAMNGAKIAVEEINALGGVQFEFQAEDDVADGETSVNAYNTLMDWGMQVLVGPVTTGAAIAVSAEVYNDRVFALTPSASSTDVISGKDNMFQVCFTDPNQGVGSADYISQNMPGAKVGIIYRNDDAYSQGIRDTFVAEAGKVGLEIVSEGTFTKDTQSDFSVQLTAAQSAGADLIFLPTYYQPNAVILNQAKGMGYAPTFFGVDGMDGILAMPGFDTSLAEGVMLLTPFSADAADERTQSFVSKYNELHGETPNQFAADGYDAVYIIYEALQAAGCTGDMSAEEICEAIVAVMPTISVDGLTGQGMTWASTGEVSKAPMAVVIKDGVYVTP